MVKRWFKKSKMISFTPCILIITAPALRRGLRRYCSGNIPATGGRSDRYTSGYRCGTGAIDRSSCPANGKRLGR